PRRHNLCPTSAFLTRLHSRPTPRLPPLSLHDALPISQLGQERTNERAGEGEQQAHGHRDDEGGVDQARGDEHADLQHRDQFRLADRKSTRLNSSHVKISYAVFCLKKKTQSKLLRMETT